MNYMESIKYLEEEVGFASVPGLSRIQALLKRLGNPEKKLRCIHVAGTNGKGSAVAMLSTLHHICIVITNGLLSMVRKFLMNSLRQKSP